jgi:outer membrane protein OmpA-like peptidoglycan-associated protein
MNSHHFFQQEDDGEFGPGTALVLSLFAVLLLVAVLGWMDFRKGQGNLPKRFIAIAEGESGESLFKAGRYDLTAEAQTKVAEVVRIAIEARSAGRNRTANHMQVIGYASPEGRGNALLAENRARAVRDYMVKVLGVPEECVVVASYADSHSSSLGRWLGERGNSIAAFRAASPEEQRMRLRVSENDLAQERRVEILGVYHTDSTCRLDLVKLRR